MFNLISNSKWAILFGCLFIMSCSERDIVRERRTKADNIDLQLKTKGYALVGTTPDGKPLYMKVIDLGWNEDRVYFTDSSITTHSTCGKTCPSSVTFLK